MTSKQLSITITIYLLVMVILHRFENSPHFGDIPTWIAAIATSIAFLFAAWTYFISYRDSKSEMAKNAYAEVVDFTMSQLNENHLSKPKLLRLLYMSFKALKNIEGQITKAEHRNVLDSK